MSFSKRLASWLAAVYTEFVAIDTVSISPLHVARERENLSRLLPKLPEPTAPVTYIMGDYPFGLR